MKKEWDYVDLFAGPGGWDVAAKRLGLWGVGVEWDHSACETRRNAGLPTIEDNVQSRSPKEFLANGLIASPPCPTFSLGGNGSGRKDMNLLLYMANKVAEGTSIEDMPGINDERSILVLEPLRWFTEAYYSGHPFKWLAFEQVPPALPIWEAYAVLLREFGYTVVTGVLNAEQYGVPQTRRRAVLMAKYEGVVSLPAPTHSHYHPHNPEQVDLGFVPPLTMKDALGWGWTHRPAPTVCAGSNGKQSGAEWGGSSVRVAMKASQGTERWSPKPGTLFGTQDSIRVTIGEAAALQTFPNDHPWHGTKTKQLEQVGNAVPPQLAYHILKSVI